MVLFLHLRLGDVPEPCILVIAAIQPGQEQEITMWCIHRPHLNLVIDEDQLVVPNLCER